MALGFFLILILMGRPPFLTIVPPSFLSVNLSFSAEIDSSSTAGKVSEMFQRLLNMSGASGASNGQVVVQAFALLIGKNTIVAHPLGHALCFFYCILVFHP